MENNLPKKNDLVVIKPHIYDQTARKSEEFQNGEYFKIAEQNDSHAGIAYPGVGGTFAQFPTDNLMVIPSNLFASVQDSLLGNYLKTLALFAEVEHFVCVKTGMEELFKGDKKENQ